jgi:AcrR family transcriptional regulator
MPGENTQNGGRTRRGEDRRREILVAARQVFSAKGYERTSMAEIAAQVGIVEGAIYKHFSSKRELLFESTSNFYEPQIAEIRQHLASIRGTRNRLRYVIARQLQSFADNPGLCRVIIQDIRPQDDYYGSVVRKLNREMTSLVLVVLDEAAKAGELRAGLFPKLVRDVIFGGIEHLAWKTLAGRGELDVEGQADALTDLVLHGIEASPAADASRESAAGLRAQLDRLEAIVRRLADERGGPGASKPAVRRRKVRPRPRDHSRPPSRA